MSTGMKVAIDWGDLCYPETFVLVTETGNCDASFVLSHAVAYKCSRPKNSREGTLLVCLINSAKHYQDIAAKLTVFNLKVAQERKDVVVIDALSTVADRLRQRTRTSSSTAEDVAQEEPSFYSHRDGLNNLYNKIVETFTTYTQEWNRWLLILDNVSFLLHTGLNKSDIFAFVEHCRHFVVSHNGCFMALVNTERPEEEVDEQQSQLCRLLAHRSDTIVNVADFSSGRFIDISGQLTVTYRKRHMCKRLANSEKRWHFKLRDGKVEMFPASISPAVL